jgi:hypothetical protein
MYQEGPIQSHHTITHHGKIVKLQVKKSLYSQEKYLTGEQGDEFNILYQSKQINNPYRYSGKKYIYSRISQ